MEKDCFVKIKAELIEAEFMGVYQYSNVLGESPMIGGHRGGVVAYPIAVVKINGMLKEVKLSEITFSI
ncbi:hypothetical protein MKY29_18490 [Psychrobacillus sp. FSL K6-2365]|uniref:hypothetical protein n=1 Tax=Psychrobacillus sp. FSL K6-2365 TaxID=2921546 RepID=UPI0030FC09D8